MLNFFYHLMYKIHGTHVLNNLNVNHCFETGRFFLYYHETSITVVGLFFASFIYFCLLKIDCVFFVWFNIALTSCDFKIVRERGDRRIMNVRLVL